MMDGYFGTGLAEMERAAAMRRRPGLASSDEGREPSAPSRQAESAQAARQAAEDLAAMTAALARARLSGRPGSYENLKARIVPVMIRSAARAIAAERGMALEQATGIAQERIEAIVDAAEGRRRRRP